MASESKSSNITPIIGPKDHFPWTRLPPEIQHMVLIELITTTANAPPKQHRESSKALRAIFTTFGSASCRLPVKEVLCKINQETAAKFTVCSKLRAKATNCPALRQKVRAGSKRALKLKLSRMLLEASYLGSLAAKGDEMRTDAEAGARERLRSIVKQYVKLAAYFAVKVSPEEFTGDIEGGMWMDGLGGE